MCRCSRWVSFPEIADFRLWWPQFSGATFERRNRLTLAERRAAMRKQRARVLGFAVPTFFLLAIPLAGVVVFPIATAAGTLLARQLLDEPT